MIKSMHGSCAIYFHYGVMLIFIIRHNFCILYWTYLPSQIHHSPSASNDHWWSFFQWHPWKLTIPKMMHWKMYMLLNMAICGIYDKFLGCNKYPLIIKSLKVTRVHLKKNLKKYPLDKYPQAWLRSLYTSFYQGAVRIATNIFPLERPPSHAPCQPQHSCTWSCYTVTPPCNMEAGNTLLQHGSWKKWCWLQRGRLKFHLVFIGAENSPRRSQLASWK